MQLYVLDRAKNTLATTASFYNDKHHKELTAGASTFEFTVDKTDDAAQYMSSGNYIVYQDDRGRAWSFTILSYDETHTTRTVFAEDVSIELLNKAMDVWNTSQAYPFSYYFDLVTKDTPWKLGVNQLTDLSRKLVYTGRDTGLGRLLSILKGFDNAECQFNVTVQQNKPVTFTVDVYKSIGTVQDNIQIVYNNELSDIKKTESRAQFVTALAGVGGLVENQATTDPGLEKHIDFADIDYKDDNFMSPKGDKFLRAVTANRMFNPGTTTYIEDFYDYDTQSAQELLNRTLTQLKERSEPQYTYDADVKVIDPTLDIGDTVTIIDHDYNPALYLQARVATLDKSYTDSTQGAITFCNYRVLNSNLSDQLRAMQNIIDQLPTSASIKVINNNIVQMIAQNEELKKQVALSFESANGKSRVWFSRSSTAQDGDIAFIKNADGATEIWKFVEGTWKLDTGLATFDDVKKAASAAADAGSQATIAGQQASAAGADAKSAGDFAASAASQSTIETAAARSTANSAVDQANLAVSQAGFANNTADQAKSAAAAAKAAAASAQSDAADALAEATKSFNDAQNAISNATKAMDAAEQNHTTVTGLVTKVDDIAGTIQTLATTQSVDKLAGTVTTVQNLAQFASDGLKLKADSSTVSSLDGRVTKLSGQLDVQADKIAATVTASDVTGMLGNYATQSWSQGQISAAKNEISASVEKVQTQVQNSAVGTNLLLKTGTPFSMTGNNIKNQWLQTYALSRRLEAGTTVTISFDAVSTAFANFLVQSDGSDGGTWMPYIFNTVDTTNKHYVATIKLDGYSKKGVYFRIDNVPSTTTITISNMKLELGSYATDWSPAPEDIATVDWTKSQLTVAKQEITGDVQNLTSDMATQTWTQGRLDLTASGFKTQVSSVQTQLDNFKVGGRNYLADTSTPWKTQGSGGENQTNSWLFTFGTINQAPFKDGEYVTVSFDYTSTGTGAYGTILPQLNSTPWAQFGDGEAMKDNGHIVRTVQWDSDWTTSGTATGIHIRMDNVAITRTVTVYNMQFERGNKDTDWSLAPEDQATVADVSSQFTQLQNDINLRVKTGDLVSQIDVNAKRILLDGASTYITNTTHIDAGVIKAAMIDDAAINNAKIANAAIDNAKIANASITAAKIADLAVGSAQIADGAISSAKIGNAAITSAKIADASIIDAKIVSLDGSKIVAHSITADQLDVNAIAVGLNSYGFGWQISPASIAFFPSASGEHASLILTGEGIILGDTTTGETLGEITGSPYNLKTDTWFNGFNTILKWGGADYWAVLSEESDGTVRPQLMYSRQRIAELGVFQGWTFDDKTHFGTIGPMDADDNAQMRVVRVQVAGFWCTGFMNSNGSDYASGILFSDVGHCFVGRKDRWYDLADIVTKIGIA